MILGAAAIVIDLAFHCMASRYWDDHTGHSLHLFQDDVIHDEISFWWSGAETQNAMPSDYGMSQLRDHAGHDI